MFYKFMGGDDQALLNVFERAVVEGTLKFGRASDFNDPFEFKFTSVPQTDRSAFDGWHRQHYPTLTPEQLDNGWDAFSGPAAAWNTQTAPRAALLGGLYVLCLAQRWDHHLMWGHYSNGHRGFAIRYRPELLAELQSLPDCQSGDVTYSDVLPELHWYAVPPDDMLRPMLFTKSRQWEYEGEHRVILAGDGRGAAVFHRIDPTFIDGVILGARAHPDLVDRAIELKRVRPELRVEQISAEAGTYRLAAEPVDPKVRSLMGML